MKKEMLGRAIKHMKPKAALPGRAMNERGGTALLSMIPKLTLLRRCDGNRTLGRANLVMKPMARLPGRAMNERGGTALEVMCPNPLLSRRRDGKKHGRPGQQVPEAHTRCARPGRDQCEDRCHSARPGLPAHEIQNRLAWPGIQNRTDETDGTDEMKAAGRAIKQMKPRRDLPGRPANCCEPYEECRPGQGTAEAQMNSAWPAELKPLL